MAVGDASGAELSGPTAWFSADGSSWEAIALANRITNCDGTSGMLDADVDAGGTNGPEVVLVGAEHLADASSCSAAGPPFRALTWISSDGQNWRRSEGFAPTARADGVMAVPGGWKALAGSPYYGTLELWESSDALRWEKASHLDDLFSVNHVQAAASDGSILMSYIPDVERPRLVTSRDGASWTTLETAGGCESGVGLILAPSVAGPDTWILTGNGICLSSDLEHWTVASGPPPPNVGLNALAHTRYGVLASGRVDCDDCTQSDNRQYLSNDGLFWTQLGSPVNTMFLAEGPVGPIGIGWEATDRTGMTVWRLAESEVADGEPAASPAQTLSVQEAGLLEIIRSDARVACAPRRVDLPPAATAGIECAPNTDLVARVGAYQFPTDRDAAKVYFDRLAEYGVSPLSGDCAAGRPGDSAWTPGDGVVEPDDPAAIDVRGALYVTHRAGCFNNENGVANYRVTCGGGISIGILGANGNLAALSEWAETYVVGESVDTPSPPGICHGSGSSP